ncbi:MAG: response regulator transcription factor [Pseudomonadota bacterium]
MNTESRKYRILVVDDDDKIRRLLRRCFEPEGYEVIEAADGAETRSALGSGSLDLITLDLNLGSEDGLSLARDIRALSDVPIIMVTGKGDLIDKVVGLEVGADDYIAKPFHVREVLARVRSVLRRSEPAGRTPAAAQTQGDGRRYRFNGWRVDFDRMELTDGDGGRCNLTSGEFGLLEVFVTNAGRVLTRDTLMDSLKGIEWAANDRSIDNQIARLRKKIESDPGSPNLIKTVRGAGYSFAAAVEPDR